MKTAFMSIVAAMMSIQASAIVDSRESYFREVVAPTLHGVMSATWSSTGPDEREVSNACRKVDWKIVRRRRSRMKDVWIGGKVWSEGNRWRLGIIRESDGTFSVDGRMWPFPGDACFMTNMAPDGVRMSICNLPHSNEAAELRIKMSEILVWKAYALRKEGSFPEASKTLRQAQDIDPLNAWSLMERAFLEDELDDSVDAVRAGRAFPDSSVMDCRNAYLGIGATNEVEFIDGRLTKRRMK